jgi:hypothetical protein
VGKKLKGEKLEKQKEYVAKAREKLEERRNELANVEVDLQVKDAKHARSPEVVSYCRQFLSDGGTWAELRRKLGLGPAWQDNRWKILRSVVIDALLPASEEEALQQTESERLFLVSKLEEFVSEIEERMLGVVGNKDEYQFWKLKLDGLKIQMEENNKSFDNFAMMKRVKHLDKKTQGPSVVVQYNYHMNRPGDDKKDVVETSKKITNLALKATDVGTDDSTK